MGSLKTRQELLHSSATAAGGAAKSMVADALKASISSVPIPIVSGFVGWAVSEFFTTLTDRVEGALDRSKQCQDLADMIHGRTLEEVIKYLDQLADRHHASRIRLFQLCELISDVNLILCVAESEHGSDCCTKVARFIKAMSHTSIEQMKELCADLSDFVQDNNFLLNVVAAAQDQDMPPKVPPEHRTIHVSSNKMGNFSRPHHEGPIFQHSSTLVPYIRRLLATTRNVGIVGMPGIGKTTIAEAVFECAKREKCFDATIWLSIGPGHPKVYDLLENAFRKLAAACQPEFNDDMVQPDFSDEKGGLHAMQQRLVKQKLKVLLVLDDVRLNVSSTSSIVKRLNFVTSSHQAGGGSRLLVTTRQQSTLEPLCHSYGQQPDSLRQLEVVEVPCLSDQHALQLFHYHAFKVTRDATAIALLQAQPAMAIWCRDNPQKPAVILAKKFSSQQLMARDAKWSAKLSKHIDGCGGNPEALQHLAKKIQTRHADSGRAERCNSLQQLVASGKDDVSMKCEQVIDGLLPSERDCLIACAALPEGFWAPEATLLHLFATHAPLHVPKSVASARHKLRKLVDCSLLCEIELVHNGRRWYSLPRILHRLALRRAHSSERDKERKGTRSFHGLAEDKQTVQYLSLHCDTCLGELMPSVDKLQACIITRARPSTLPKECKAWPRKLQLLDIAFHGPDNVAGQACQSDPHNGDLCLLNSLCLAGDRAPLILLNRLLHAPQLLHIDLSRCVSLDRLPDCIGHCTQLMHLYLNSCTNLEKLSDRLGDCTVLADLDLSECSALSELPLTIGGCSGLADLRLSGCSRLGRLPDSMNKCSELVHLDLKGCSALASDGPGMPGFIDDWTDLAHLDLHGCSSLTTLPDTITSCTNLQVLCLSACCNLQQLPAELWKCAELAHLDLSDCVALQLLEPLVFSSLTYISFSGSNIKDVPPSVIDLPRLACLDLSRCAQLQRLPVAFGESGCTRLARLNLSDCSAMLQVCQGPSSTQHQELAKIAQLHLGMLTLLDLSQCADMTQLMLAIDQLSMLAHLSLRGCPKLMALPAGLGGCSQLTHLDLGECSQLERLPEAQAISSQLAYLTLSGCSRCDMQHLEEYIGEALVHIELSGCIELMALPDCLGSCSQLTHLKLDGCSKIAALPCTIPRCKMLAHLSLSGCSSMADLQDCVGICTFLTEVNLSGCKKVPGLPERIGMCLQLAKLDLRGCTGMKSLPKSINYCIRLRNLVIQRAQVPALGTCLPNFEMRHDERAPSLVTYTHSSGAPGGNQLFAC